jgi:hypothetical protein
LVDGTEKKPDASDPMALENWLLWDKEARAQITLTLKDEPLSGVLYVPTAQEVWKRLNERYEGKGQQSVAYLIGKLFHSTLSDDSEMEPQLNAMQQKVYVLRSLGQPLDDSLVIIAIKISLPTSYSTLRTILMTTADKLTVNSVISQILIERRSRKPMQSALVAKGSTSQKSKERSKEKSKEKSKEGKKRKKCEHYGWLHGGECWKKLVEEAIKNKSASSSNEKDK